MAYKKGAVGESILDPTQFGNWVLHEKLEFDNEPIGTPSVEINGDQYDRIKIIAHMAGGDGNESYPSVRFNNDSGDNYTECVQYGGDTHNGTKTVVDRISLVLTDNKVSDAEVIISPKSGAQRSCLAHWGFYRDSSGDYTRQSYIMWTNTVDEITSLDFFDFRGTTNCNCTIEVYVWQELKPVELHSYELIKSITPSNEAVDFTFDMYADDDIYISGSYYTQTAGSFPADALYFRPNGSSSSFVVQWLYGNASGTGAANNAVNGFFLGGAFNSSRTEVFNFNFKNVNNGAKRQAITTSAYEDAGDERIYLMNSVWGDTSTDITSGQVHCGANITGRIDVYRLAKTHLISSNPGLLKGMWQKSIDADTVEVQPGDIEIGGTICNLTAAKQITLSGNLRSGESEAADTYYYLYAIRGDGRSVSFKFSAQAPTMDRFGNTVTSFEDCDSDQDWYHPIEGRTWRYIGQVYNDSGSDILGFTKCKPGYWESTWTAIPGTGTQTVSHGCARTDYSPSMRFANSASPTTVYAMVFQYMSSTYTYGIVFRETQALSSATLSFGTGGSFRDESTWQTTGYYKLILKA